MAAATDRKAIGDAVRFRNGLVSRNRIVLAAMTNRQSYADGTLSDDEIQFLAMRAAGGCGIVTTACAHVSADGQGFPGELGVFADRHVAQLSRLAKILRDHGSISLVQIFHAGLRAPQALTGVQPLAPSVVPCKESATGAAREASARDIERIISDFAAGARRVAHAGFDGVELHAAHGYLINQFLGKETNLRRDTWGGGGGGGRAATTRGRSRFLLEIIAAVRAVVPSTFLVGLRISPEKNCGFSLRESIELCADVRDTVDFLHLSVWDAFRPAAAQAQRHGGRQATITEAVTRAVAGLPPVITTGSVWTGGDAHAVLGQGADMIGVGRAAIGNPDWATQIVAAPKLYRPLLPPFTEADLQQRCGLSPVFCYYMRRWGFVCAQDGTPLAFDPSNFSGVKM